MPSAVERRTAGKVARFLGNWNSLNGVHLVRLEPILSQGSMHIALQGRLPSDVKELWSFFKGLYWRKANVPVNNGLIDSTSAISSLRLGQLQGTQGLFINIHTCSSSTAEKRDKLFLVRSFIDAFSHSGGEGCFGRLRRFALGRNFQVNNANWSTTNILQHNVELLIEVEPSGWACHITNLNKFQQCSTQAQHRDSKPIIPFRTLIANLQPASTG